MLNKLCFVTGSGEYIYTNPWRRKRVWRGGSEATHLLKTFLYSSLGWPTLFVASFGFGNSFDVGVGRGDKLSVAGLAKALFSYFCTTSLVECKIV